MVGAVLSCLQKGKKIENNKKEEMSRVANVASIVISKKGSTSRYCWQNGDYFFTNKQMGVPANGFSRLEEFSVLSKPEKKVRAIIDSRPTYRALKAAGKGKTHLCH